jgi:glucose-6-phosphate isomerase
LNGNLAVEGRTVPAVVAFAAPDPAPMEERCVTLGDLAGVFAGVAALPLSTPVYTVACVLPVAEGTEGGLFRGTTTVWPGQVAGEYFMTRGHFHAKRNRAEFYWCTGGRGLLLLMDAARRCRAERMEPGSVHYIPGGAAHRAVNTGDGPLSFEACWPSDAGHDYAALVRAPFPWRVFCVDGAPAIVEAVR